MSVVIRFLMGIGLLAVAGYGVYRLVIYLAGETLRPKFGGQGHEMVSKGVKTPDGVEPQDTRGSDEVAGQALGAKPAEQAPAAPVEEDPFAKVPAALRPLHWRILSSNSKARLTQQATASDTCQLACTLNDAEVWSASGCLATLEDWRFVSNDCEQVLIFAATAEKADAPVVRRYSRAKEEHVYTLAALLRAPGKALEGAQASQWVQGGAGQRGQPPGYREDGLGVDFGTLDGASQTLAFQPGVPLMDLLEEGSEPRTVLRRRLKAGRKELLAVELEVASFITLEGRSPSTLRPPRVRLTLALTPRKPGPEGAMEVAYEVKGVKVIDADAREGLSPEQQVDFKRLAQARGVFSITAEGLVFPVKAPAVKLSQDGLVLLPLVQTAIEQIIALFPREPVGKGARWRAQWVAEDHSRILWRTCTLDDLRGLEGSLTCDEQSEVLGVPALLPNYPQGEPLRVDRQKRRMRTTLVFDTAKLASPGTIELDLRSTLLWGESPKASRIQQELRGNVGLSPARR